MKEIEYGVELNSKEFKYLKDSLKLKILELEKRIENVSPGTDYWDILILKKEKQMITDIYDVLFWVTGHCRIVGESYASD